MNPNDYMMGTVAAHAGICNVLGFIRRNGLAKTLESLCEAFPEELVQRVQKIGNPDSESAMAAFCEKMRNVSDALISSYEKRENCRHNKGNVSE